LYSEIRQHCIDLGLLKPGRGRGGSVSRIVQEKVQLDEEVIQPNESSATTEYSSKDGGVARSLADAAEAFKSGNLTAASEIWRRLAGSGVPSAQYNLAQLHMAGHCVGRDPAKACEWFARAADQGHAKAQYQLARSYESGNGIGIDLEKAEYWYRQAIEIGLSEANVALAELLQRSEDEAYDEALADLLEDSEETPSFSFSAQEFDDPDDDQDDGDRVSIACCREAALAGDGPAMRMLGLAYFDGNGVPVNTIAGYALLLLAKEASDEEAAQRLEVLAKTEGCPKGAHKLVARMSKLGKFLEALDKHIEKSQARRKTDKVYPRSQMV